MTYEDVLLGEDSFKHKVLYWAAAYGKGGKPEAAVLDVKGTCEMDLRPIGGSPTDL